MIPFIDVQTAPGAHERVLEVLRSGRFIGGPVVDEAECVAARLMGRRAAVGVGSGTDALMLALQAVGVRPGDEVVVPALSFFATAGAVIAIGARPVVADVTEDGLLDADDAARAMSSATRALVPVHLFGSRAPCPDLGVPVVDDACQAVGADPSCSEGLLSAVSTYPTKLWGAAGDGGFVLGDDLELLERVRRLGSHGAVGMHLHAEVVPGAVGRNTRLDAVQAAVLLAAAEALPGRLALRREHMARYDAGLGRIARPLPRTFGSPASPYVVRVARRDQCMQALHDADIGCSVYYPRSLSAQPALKGNRATPVADALSAELLALPLHAGMSVADVDRVIAVVEGL